MVRRLLASHPALSALTEQDQSALLQGSRTRILKRKAAISRQGDAVTAVVLVLEGYVKLSRQLADGGSIFLEVVGPGGTLGEIQALHRQPHGSDITALSSCRLLVIDARYFRRVFERQPEGLLAMLRIASDRVQHATQQLVDTCVLPAAARLAKTLLRLTRFSACGSDGLLCLPFRLSQSELGMMTGLCREVVNKQLRAWLASGCIRMSGGAVTSIHADALIDLLGDAGFDTDSDRMFA